jgi:hypothetical protein
MKRSSVILLLIVVGIVSFATGYLCGFKNHGFELALYENKVAVANLMEDRDFHGGTNLPPQFREYLKARIYCNVYNYYPSTRGYLLQKDWDFGPVDRDKLGSLVVWKDPDQKVWNWEDAIKGK